MLSPISAAVPSEATVEQLANHQLLNLISPYGAWFFVPTKREEQQLGYDASLQDHKALVIQYKRLIASKRSPYMRVRISRKQHATLMRNFPRASTPYVFYSFALLSSYADLQSLFSAGNGVLFGLHMIFIDAHSVPVGVTSFSLKGGAVSARTGRKRSPMLLDAFDSLSLARGFVSCHLGVFAGSRPETGREATARDVAVPNLHILWAYLPKAARP